MGEVSIEHFRERGQGDKFCAKRASWRKSGPAQRGIATGRSCQWEKKKSVNMGGIGESKITTIALC